MADDDVGRGGFVAGQRDSVGRLPKRDSGAAGSVLGLDVRSSDLVTPVISTLRVTRRVTMEFWTSFIDSQSAFL